MKYEVIVEHTLRRLSEPITVDVASHEEAQKAALDLTRPGVRFSVRWKTDYEHREVLLVRPVIKPGPSAEERLAEIREIIETENLDSRGSHRVLWSRIASILDE